MARLARFCFPFLMLSATGYSAQTNLDCLYVIDGVDHVAKINLSDSSEEPGYKMLSVVINDRHRCEDYAAASPNVANGKKYLKYLLDCGDDVGLFTLYEPRQEGNWLLTLRFNLIGSPFTMEYECKVL